VLLFGSRLLLPPSILRSRTSAYSWVRHVLTQYVNHHSSRLFPRYLLETVAIETINVLACHLKLVTDTTQNRETQGIELERSEQVRSGSQSSYL
jgi:hypothetical protein